MFYLVCFDIVDDRVKQRVAKAVKAYSQRVQKSAFERPRLTEEKYLNVKGGAWNRDFSIIAWR